MTLLVEKRDDDAALEVLPARGLQYPSLVSSAFCAELSESASVPTQ